MADARPPAVSPANVAYLRHLRLEAERRLYGRARVAACIEQRAERPWPHGHRVAAQITHETADRGTD